MSEKNKMVWQILVPRYSNSGEEFSIAHHRAWDEAIRNIAGGITIFRTAKGHWVNPEGKIFIEEMIPVIIFCSEDDIIRIVDFTIGHYDQEAVSAYKISSRLIIRHKADSEASH